jgi:hypothetical protein
MTSFLPHAALILSLIGSLLGARQVADAAESCECMVQVGNQNRAIWGSWALECNNHGGHGDCPTTNIDNLHSPGESAMTGRLMVQARAKNKVHASWKRDFPDDHYSAFKGPIWDGMTWIWTNTCSCDAYYKKSCGGIPRSQWTDPGARMYSGPQSDEQYIWQGKTGWLKMPGACGAEEQELVIDEKIVENDPYSPSDLLGTLGVRVKPALGTRSYTQWVQHFEPAYDSRGRRTHAGNSGGSFGAEIVVEVACRKAG